MRRWLAHQALTLPPPVQPARDKWLASEPGGRAGTRQTVCKNTAEIVTINSNQVEYERGDKGGGEQAKHTGRADARRDGTTPSRTRVAGRMSNQPRVIKVARRRPAVFMTRVASCGRAFIAWTVRYQQTWTKLAGLTQGTLLWNDSNYWNPSVKEICCLQAACKLLYHLGQRSTS